MADGPNLTDFRIAWIKNKILTLLRIKDQNEWNKMIGRNNFYVYKRLIHFIECEGSPDGLNRDDGVFIVFKSGYPKRYKKEIFFRKIATKVKTFTRSVSVAPVSKSKKKSGKRNSSGKGVVKPLKVTPKKVAIKGSPSKPGNIVRRDSIGEKKGQTNDKRRSSKRPSAMGVMGSPSTVIGGIEKYKVAIKECIKLKKIIKKVKLHDQLHGHFGYPKQLQDDTIYAYILRKLITPIPVFDRYCEAEAELPSYFLVGTFNGRYARCAHSTMQAHFLCLRDGLMDPSSVALESAGCLKHPDEILRNIGYPADIMSSPTFMPKLSDCCKGINDCVANMRNVNKVLLFKKILELKSEIKHYDIEHDSRYTIDDLIKQEREIDWDKIYTMKTILTKDVQTISDEDLAELFLEIRYSIYYKRNIDPMVEFRPKPEPLKYNLLYYLNRVINGVTRLRSLERDSWVKLEATHNLGEPLAKPVVYLIRDIIGYTETMKWTEIILSSANINLFNLIKKHGENRHIQLKILEEDPRFIQELTNRMVPWTNYINNICSLLENANLGKNILHLYYSSKNTFMIIWPILAHIDKTACMRNITKIMKCTNPKCYIQFLDATKRLRLNFRTYFYTALFLAPFLEDIKMLSTCENLNYIEKSWANLNTFSTMLRTFYSSGSTAFNQLASVEETERFSIGKIILNIHEKLAPMYIRFCEKIFFDNWPKLNLKNLELLCQRIPEFLKDYKGFVDEKFYDFISGKTTERQQYNQYIDTVTEHCLKLSIMAKVLRYFKHIFGVLFPTMPRNMVYQNILKSSLRDIMNQLFGTRLNIFDIKADENALLHEWFWTAIRQLSVVAIDVIDLTFDDLTSSLGTLKYMKFHKKNKVNFFLYDKLMSKYPKIMDKYIQEANEFHDILVRSCPNPPRIFLFPFYTNRLYFLRFIASSSYGTFRRITRVPEISNCNQYVLGEKWKNYNVQKAANLEFLYINQFLKTYLYEFEDICSTKCLKVVQRPGAKWPFKECYYKHLIAKLLKKYFIPQQLSKEFDSLEEESLKDEEAIKNCLKKLFLFQNKLNTYKLLSESENASESEGREESEMFLYNQYYCLDMIISNYDRYAKEPLFKFLKPPNDTKFRKNIRYRPTLCKLPRPKHGASFNLFIDDATNPVRRFYLFPISNKSKRTILTTTNEDRSMDVDKFLNNLRRIDKSATCPVRNRYTHFNPKWWKIFAKRNPCYKLRKYKWIPYKPADATVGNLCFDVQDLDKLHTTWAESYGDSLMAEHHFTFEVNFDEKYYNLMSEVNQLGLLGYHLPEEFVNILAHMKLIVKKLQVMSLSVNKFNKLYDSMPRHHVTVLKPHIIPLEMYLRYACKSLSWGRSWLDSWLKSVDQKILHIKKNNLAIAEKKLTISKNLKEVMSNTFEFPQEILLPQKFFSYLAGSYADRLLYLRSCQRKVADNLIELEWELYGTENGSHKLFGGLYRKVERSFKDCLVRSLMKDLNKYKQWLEDGESSKIRIQLEYGDGKLRISPNIKLLHKILSNIVFGIVKTQCRIPRWLNNTVHEAPRMLVERYVLPTVENPSLRHEQTDWDRKLDPLYFIRPKTFLWGRTENMSEWFNQMNPLDNYKNEAGVFLTSKYSPPRSIQRIDKEKIKEKIIKLNYKYAEAYKSKDYVDYSTFNTVWYNEFLPTNLERCITIDDLSVSSESFMDEEEEFTIFDENISENEELSRWDMDKDIESIDEEIEDIDDDKYIVTKTTNIPMLEPIYFDEMYGTDTLKRLCPLTGQLQTQELEEIEEAEDVNEEDDLDLEEEIYEELMELDEFSSISEPCQLIPPESKSTSTEYLPLGDFSTSEETVYSFDFMKYLQDIGIKKKESKIEYLSTSTESSEPFDLIDVDTVHKLFKSQIWWKTEADKAGELIRKLDLREIELDQMSMCTDSEHYVNNEDYPINKLIQMRENTTQHKRRLEKLKILRDSEHAKGSKKKFAIKKDVIDRAFHRYSYIHHLIGNRKIVKSILEIQQRHINLFEELNSCQVRWSEVLQMVMQQRNKYEYQKPTFAESLMEIEQIDASMKYLEEFGASVDVGCLRLEFGTLYEISLNTLQITRKIHLHRMLGEIEYLLVKNYKFLKDAVVSLKTELTTLKSFHDIMRTIDEVKNMANNIWWEFWICNVQITTLEMQKLFNVSPFRRLFKVMCQLWDRAWLSAYYRKYFIQYAFEVLNAKVLLMIKSYEELCAECVRRYYLEGPGSILEDWEEAMDLQLAFLKEFIDIKIAKHAIDYTQKVFSLPSSDYTAFNAAYDECVNLPQLDAINLKLQKFEGDYGECSWKKIRIPDAMQELIKIEEAMSRLPDSLKQHHIIERIKRFITNYEILLNPLLSYLLSPSLADRHWERIFLLADQQKPDSIDALKVNDLYKLRLYRYTAEIESILRTADLEWYTQRFLDDCAEYWSNFSFVTEDHFVEVFSRSTVDNATVWEKSRKNRGKMIANLDQIKVTLYDYLTSFQLKQNYKHAIVHHSCMRGWQDVLSLCTEVVNDLEKVQKSWILIERIFFSNQFHDAAELGLFNEIDNGFHQIMSDICAAPHVIRQCQRIYNGSILINVNRKLQECLGMVNVYLDEKRETFPRFFFVNNEELLEVLGAKHPSDIRPYVSKLFTNVTDFIINEDSQNREFINGVISYEQEKFEFNNKIDFQAPVEEWMSKVLNVLKSDLRIRIKQCIYDLTYVNMEVGNIDWIMSNLGVPGIIAHSVWWVKDVENAFNYEKGLSELRSMVRQRLEEVKDALLITISKVDRDKIILYYLFYCHIRDIVENLIYEKVTSALDFGWKRHIRHYWQRDLDTLILRQCAGAFEYGFEYTGLKRQLVVTPVTSRIYLAMTQAISKVLGCAVVGPCGVGKNETIKDLARTMGRFIVVCTCNESLDYVTVYDKVKGCCMGGSWLILDKFGRLTEIVQNYITRDIQRIFETLKGNIQKTSNMTENFAIFLTLRTENYCISKLNGCLKKQLRIITYVYPDIDKICQTLLFAEGFTNIQSLSKKILSLFRNGPPGIIERHYGAFNLKEMVTLLKTAGSVKSRWPNVAEEATIVTAVKITYQPRLSDEKAMVQLLEDIFTGIPLLDLEDAELVDKIKFILSEKQYLYIPQQVTKIGELYSVLQSHHSAIVVGPTCAGKSVIINILTTIDGEVDDYSRRIIISPKAFPKEEFFGVRCSITNEWIDGYLTSGLKYVNKNPSINNKYYLIFDGQMDPSWMDDIFSLLDDKKMVSLPNNETIHLNENVAIIFETGGIEHLSPAFLSRIGIVHVAFPDLPYRTYWTKFLLQRKDADLLNPFYEKYIPQVIDVTCETSSSELIERSITFCIPQCTMNMLIQFCELLSSLIPPPKYYSDEESGEYEEISEVVVEAYFITAIYFSFGANITYDCQIVFDNFMKELTTFSPYEDRDYNYAPLYTYPVLMPTMYDYYVDSINECWMPWKAMVTPYQHYPGVSVNYLFVQTSVHAKIMWLLQQMKKAHRPTILLGETCSSKTALMKEFLRRQDPEENIFLYTTFSYGTSAKTISGSFQPILQKCAKEMYNMSANICIDDLNAPRVDAYGSQEPLAYLKMLIEREGTNDLQLPWKHYKNFFLFGAITWNSNTTKIDPRFLSQFSIFFTEPLSPDHIKHIYTAILKHHTKEFYHDVRNMVPELVFVTNKILKVLSKELPQLPSRLHYTFNIYETSRVIDGLFLIHPKIFKTTDQMFRIWRNEFLHCVSDKLINEEERKFVDDIIEKEVSNLTQEDFLPYIMANPIIFADFRCAALRKKEERYYEDMLDYRALHDILLILLVEYNAKYDEPLELTLIVEAMENIIKIHRVLRMRGGSMLLVSPRCYGKLTLTKLASFIAECGLFVIETDLGYGEKLFIEDIKTLLEIVGIHKLDTALYISDKCIKQEYMTILDSLLATSSVPWIYTDSEVINIHNIFYDTVAELNLTPNRYECWKMFATNCKKHLHLVIGLDESIYLRDELNSKFTNYPALLKFATINWILPIAKESLIDVATISLKREPLLPRIYKKSLARSVALIHDSASYCYGLYKIHDHYLGFRNVLDLVTHFAQLYHLLKKEIEEKNFWLKKGVESYYHCMKHLIEQNANLSMRLVVITKLSGFYYHLAKMNLTLSKSIAEKINIINQINEEIKYLKEVIIEYRLKLYRATYTSLHNFVSARKDLLNITEEELDNFRKPNCPIKSIKHVSLALCAVITDDSLRWAEAHKLIAQHNFIEMLKRAHPKRMSKATVDFIKNLLKGKEVCTCSSVERIYGIFVRYLRRFIDFHGTYSAQQTGFYAMRIREQTLKKTYSKMLGIVENVRTMKCKVSRNLKLMPKVLSLVNGIKADIPVRKRYVSEVGKLVVLLREEFIRWHAEYKTLIHTRLTLIGTTLLLSAFINYLGPLNGLTRKKLLRRWRRSLRTFHIPVCKKIDLTKPLLENWEVPHWHANGLKRNQFSLQNAILTMKSYKCPMLIDPEKQMIKFLKKIYEMCTFYEVSIDDPEFKKIAKEAIRVGAALLIKNVYSMNKTLESLVNKNIIDEIDNRLMKFDGEVFIYNSNFQIFLYCGSDFRRIDPELYYKTNVINANVYLEILIPQITDLIYSVEFPTYNQLLIDISNRLNYLDTHLEMLRTLLYQDFYRIRNNLLDNEQVKLLCKRTHIEKVMILTEYKKLTNEKALILEDTRRYKPVAIKLAIMYMSLSEICIVNPLCVHPLDAFMDIIAFTVAIPYREDNELVGPKKMIGLVPLAVYKYVIAGFLNKDKLLFAFYLATRWQLFDQFVDLEKINYIIRGCTQIVPEEISGVPWLSKKRWTEVMQLTQEFPYDFDDLMKQIADPLYSAGWQMWYEAEYPEIEETPHEVYNDYCMFKKLLLIKCLRKDRLYPAIKMYVDRVVGEGYLENFSFNFKQIFLWNIHNGPVLFIEHNDANIMDRLMNHARECGQIDDVSIITIGQSTDEQIIEAYRRATELESWLILKECYLWTDKLNEIFELNANLQHVNEEKYTTHRLWLITYSTTNLPQELLLKSVKVVVQNQKCLREVMNYAMSSLSEDYIELCGNKHFGLVLYALTFVHGVLNVRSKYGKVCWNISYDFGQNVYKLCADLVSYYMSDLTDLSESCINWEYIKYMLGEVFHGGQTLDHYDKQLINVYINEFFDDNLVLKNHMLWNRNLCKFKFDTSDDYDVKDYLNEIQKIPMDNAPELMGLQNNAIAYYYLDKSNYICESLARIDDHCETPNMIINKHAEFLKRLIYSIKQKIPVTFDIKQEHEEEYEELTRTESVFQIELVRFNDLIGIMIQTTDELTKVLDGEIAASQELEDFAHSIFSGKLPSVWGMYAPDTTMGLARWINHFCQRARQYKGYTIDGMPSVVWLSGLHHPRAYLVALLVEACKLKHLTLSNISFYTEIIDMKQIQQAYYPKREEYHITGLYLQNASWDDNLRCIVKPNRFYPLTELIPLIKIVPYKRSTDEESILVNKVLVPVYTTPCRKNVVRDSGVVFDATLPTSEHPGKWILHGLCLLLNAD